MHIDSHFLELANEGLESLRAVFLVLVGVEVGSSVGDVQVGPGGDIRRLCKGNVNHIPATKGGPDLLVVCVLNRRAWQDSCINGKKFRADRDSECSLRGYT